VHSQEEPVNRLSDAVPACAREERVSTRSEEEKERRTHPRSAEMGSTALSLTSSLSTMWRLNICLMSSTAMAPSQSCLLARTSVGTPSTRWSVTIVSARARGRWRSQRLSPQRSRGGEQGRTEDGPALLYPLLVGRVDDEDDGVAVGVVLCPDAADVALPCARAASQRVARGSTVREGDAPPRSQNCSTVDESVILPTASGAGASRQLVASERGRRKGNALFCPMVGAMLLGSMSAVRLKVLLTFSASERASRVGSRGSAGVARRAPVRGRGGTHQGRSSCPRCRGP